MEKPANTGCTTHGDFSAPMVSPAGTTGDIPAAITRISSGVNAAIASELAARSITATRPVQPYSVASGGAIPPRPPLRTGGYPPPVAPRAEHHHADDPDERDPGEPRGQRHCRAGERER